MNRLGRRQSFWAVGMLVLGLLASAPSWAQAQAPSSDEQIRQTVARVSFLAGSVSYARGDDPDNWQAVDFNVPLTVGDRLYTGDDGRVELQVHGGFHIRVGAQADFETLNLTDDTKQWSLRAGYAAFQLRRLGQNEVFEVDTPNAAVTFERTGEYRVDVDADGNTRIAVRRGRALVAAGGGQVPVNAGDQMNIDGADSPRYDVVAMREPDSFDGWVRERERRSESARSHQYVHADVVGAADLDEHGRWQSIPSYGMVWTPTVAEAGWQPYRAGHWIWQDPWGWTWVAAEPWGWAPYHYGRWVNWSSRWWWVPVARTVRALSYAPALVAFSGGGPGWSTPGGGGFVGWFPLAPRDPFHHWWGQRAGMVDVTNVRYVNRSYITVVNRSTFISGGIVTTNWVRDRSVVTTVMHAPILRGPLPLVPTPGSLRIAARPGLPPVIRPPQLVAARTVVVHAAPPPRPPTFRAKVTVIEKNHGAPVGSAAAARIVETGAGRPAAYRPAAAGPGRVTLAPRGQDARVPKPQPVAPVRGRPMVTGSGASAPSTSSTTPDRGRSANTARPTPGAQPDHGRSGSAAHPTPAPRPSSKASSKNHARPATAQPDRSRATPARREPAKQQPAPAHREPAKQQPKPQKQQPKPHKDEKKNQVSASTASDPGYGVATLTRGANRSAAEARQSSRRTMPTARAMTRSGTWSIRVFQSVAAAL
jgi:hypothetical protein